MKKPDELPLGTERSGAADALEALLRQAREDGFTRLETGELWTRLSLAVGMPSAATPSAPTVGGVTSVGVGGLTAKSVAILLLGSGAAMVVGGLAARSIAGHGHGPGAGSGYGVSTAMQESPERDERSSPLPPRAPDAPSEGESITLPAAPPVAIGPERARRPELLKSRGLVGRPSAPSAEALDPSVKLSHADPMPVSGEPGQASRSTGPSIGWEVDSRESTHPAPMGGDPGINEGALLLMARREMGSNPSGALELTQQHAKLFPKGALVPEREVLAIEALLQLGRAQEARSRFDALRTQFPRSPHIARVQAMFGR
jgi:hypothetical protein